MFVSLPGVPAGPPLPSGAAEATGQDIVHYDAVPRFRSRFRCRWKCELFSFLSRTRFSVAKLLPTGAWLYYESRHFHSKISSAIYGANFQTLIGFRPFLIVSKPSFFPEIVSNLIVSNHTLSLSKYWKHFSGFTKPTFFKFGSFSFFLNKKQDFKIIDRNKPAIPKLFKTNKQ